ncbi:putative d-stereospecific peptide hydrolase protein [Botrytis fragariae]|uniref:Putative d-stereospecific peptide hydrolase protein n=1 Tax=Botrytis fragariae TaxID=1964551 RepID=A0A8H6ENV3_9HELO|nr:putative d-stereospecific peptide hydrolase protein [Botrytis fragariae]KAF5878999.1 putative d-stereospecific peptide hydrolase protein [Botrytis fragariae]
MENNHNAKRALSKSLRSILQSGIDAGVPGVSAAIATSKGIIWRNSAGFAVLEKNILDNDSTVFGIGSITKAFVAVVILQLIEESQLNMSDKISEHLNQEYLDGIGNANDATIADLLSHTAGVESWEDDPNWITEAKGEKLDPKIIWDKKDTLKYVRRPSRFETPRFSYSNTNYTLLGLIVEKIVGHSAESEICRRILDPLNLMDTFLEEFEQAGPRKNNMPNRYDYATDEFRNTAGSNLSVEWVAGGMISSTCDLLKFAIYLRDGKLFSPSSMDLLKIWQPATESTEIGHGIFRFGKSRTQTNWLGHNGSVLGFTGSLWWNEEIDCIVCVLANVRSTHAGKVSSSAPQIAFQSELLEVAKELTNIAVEYE